MLESEKTDCEKIITAVIVSGAIGVLPLMAQEKPPCQFEKLGT